ncbi:hypothetical protein WA026_012500 [Henosepilachna vigintioctopunctata]|uniref:CCHC-type domain-containing protein n=1 Tax=Henosepilachna vigintioctopunctata TaxID=420089 RepID=A0AAW1UQD8_9CUCU
MEERLLNMTKYENGITSNHIQNRTTSKPPTFDGETSWLVFKKEFEAAAQINGWNDKIKAVDLILSLRGKTADVLQKASERDQEDYLLLMKALGSRYGDNHKEMLHQAQLEVRCQQHNERLQEFHADIERLTRLAYPMVTEDMLELFCIKSFISGLRDSELIQHLKIIRPKTGTEALVRALEFEAAKATPTQSRTSHKVRQVEKEKDTIISELIKQLKAIVSLSRVNRVSFRGECYSCGKYGHSKRECRSRRNRDEDSKILRGRTLAVDTIAPRIVKVRNKQVESYQ